MKSFKKAFNKSDNYYTPKMLVKPLIPFLDDYFCIFANAVESGRAAHTIYCPFDTEKSEYVITLKEAGYNVIFGSLETGQDFFEKPIPKEADIVVSNPPFSLKLEVFTKCVYEEKPFALLMNMMAINYQEIGFFFASLRHGDIQFIIPDKKVSFNGKTSSFCSGYVCYKFIKNTVFIHLEHNNTGVNYKPAAYYQDCIENTHGR